VRCGHCQTVFDGNDNLVSLAAPSTDAEDNAERGNAALATPARTRSNEQAPDSTREQTIDSTREQQSLDSTRDQALDSTPVPPLDNSTPAQLPDTEPGHATTIAPEVEENEAARDDEEQIAPATDSQEKRRRHWSIVFALSIPVLLLLLVGQAAFHLRDAIASRWPAAGPALTTMCAAAGCAIRPLHEIGYLSIDASDLEADPAHKGLLILTATVRNRAAYALAYPYLELTLTDSLDRVVVRRALAPREYAGGTADLESGILPNTEVMLKLFIDASATTQAGYRVYLFYP
jgi:hypothetical protein